MTVRGRALLIAALGGALLVLDGVAFVLAVRHVGIAGELNPVAIALFGSVGPSGVLAAKVLQAVVAASIALWLANRGHRRAVAAACIPAVAGGIGVLTAIVTVMGISHGMVGVQSSP